MGFVTFRNSGFVIVAEGRKLGLREVDFFIALDSADLILLSSSVSLATSSDKYSDTVFHPAGDLSAILISLFLFWISACSALIFLENLLKEPCLCSFSTSSRPSAMDMLNSSCFWLPMYFSDGSCFVFNFFDSDWFSFSNFESIATNFSSNFVSK